MGYLGGRGKETKRRGIRWVWWGAVGREKDAEWCYGFYMGGMEMSIIGFKEEKSPKRGEDTTRSASCSQTIALIPNFLRPYRHIAPSPPSTNAGERGWVFL